MDPKCIIFGLITLVIGIFFFTGVGSNWIKAWRGVSREGKNKIRMKELSRNVGCVFLAAGAILLSAGFSPVFLHTAFTWCMIAWFTATGIDVAYITKSEKYKDNLPERSGPFGGMR